jgi:hypothetical protein
MKTPTALSVTSSQREQTSLRFQVPRLPRSNVCSTRDLENPGKAGTAIEGITGPELPIPDVTRQRSADAGRQPSRRSDEGYVARIVDAEGAGIEHRRRIPDAAAEIEVVIYGVGALGVLLVEAQVLLDDNAVW